MYNCTNKRLCSHCIILNQSDPIRQWALSTLNTLFLNMFRNICVYGRTLHKFEPVGSNHAMWRCMDATEAKQKNITTIDIKTDKLINMFKKMFRKPFYFLQDVKNCKITMLRLHKAVLSDPCWYSKNVSIIKTQKGINELHVSLFDLKSVSSQIKHLESYCSLSVLFKTVWFGAVHKGHPHKIANNWPPCPHWLNPLPSCPCGHTITFEKSDVFLIKKCGCPHLNPPSPSPQNVRTGQAPPPRSADVLYGRPLSITWKAFSLKQVCTLLILNGNIVSCVLGGCRLIYWYTSKFWTWLIIIFIKKVPTNWCCNLFNENYY